jgi:hypothetical protein
MLFCCILQSRAAHATAYVEFERVAVSRMSGIVPLRHDVVVCPFGVLPQRPCLFGMVASCPFGMVASCPFGMVASCLSGMVASCPFGMVVASCPFGMVASHPVGTVPVRLQLLAHSFFMPFALTCCAAIASEYSGVALSTV